MAEKCQSGDLTGVGSHLFKQSMPVYCRQNKLLFLLAVLAFIGHAAHNELAAAEFVGGSACQECHQAQSSAWTGSHHDLAMQAVDDTAVLGDFDDSSFTYQGVETRFYKNQGDYFIKTDGPDGEIREYRVKYVFGVEPLQQYLIELENGRIQAFTIAWDTRDRSAGGQRWFHLYAGEDVAHTDPLHWTAPSQNWNFMCASCHSTDFKKNYDHEKQAFFTAYSDIDVTCEACHGPGSDHVEWAGQNDPSGMPNKGLIVSLKNTGQWQFVDRDPIARLTGGRISRSEVETCAFCHSRRSELSPDYVHGNALLDTHLPSLLQPDLYYPDGQIDEEVYVYGSFLQSRMYRQGVTCSNCHDPHSLKLKAKGNALCAQCHLDESYNTADHHHHEADSSGAQCISCHMAEKTFMVIDDRADHSFRVPRPDLSLKTGSPNACTLCHTERSDEWAQDYVRKWYPDGVASEDRRHYGEVFHAFESGSVDAENWLNYLAQDSRENSIVRATAVSHISSNVNPATYPALIRSLRSDDPLIIVSALPVLEYLRPAEMRKFAREFLSHDLRVIRIETARVLAARRYLLEKDVKVLFDAALDEYLKGLAANADRAEYHVNLGNLYLRQDDFISAEKAFVESIRLNPHFIPGYINLADLYRAMNRDERGRLIIEQALARHPEVAALHHAMGLLEVRQKNIGSALESLKQAAELEHENSRYQYVFAIALYTSGDSAQALQILNRAHRARPSDRQILSSLVSINSELGNHEDARAFAQKLSELSPWDVSIKNFLKQGG